LNAKEALAFARTQISPSDAIRLLSFCENCSKEALIANNEQNIDFDKYQNYVLRRAAFEPIEYIINSANFYDLDFYVNENVLIPRCETEILVDIAKKLIAKYNFKNIADICTGSGAICCTLAKTVHNINIYASDISQDALCVAELNAKALKAEIEFLHGDLLAPFKNKKIDFFISNPPYIANSYKLDEYVLKEPHIALFGGDRGDEILYNLIEQFSKTDAKALLCEMGYDQKEYIKMHCDKIGLEPIFYSDLAGFDRGFYIIANT
jgi:release factor glutamine methyltransferase